MRCCCCLCSLGGLELFRQFLRSEYSEENLEFWIACEEYRTMRDERQLVPQAQKIFTDFVAIQAPREVRYILTSSVPFGKTTHLPSWKTLCLLTSKLLYDALMHSNQAIVPCDLKQTKVIH
jgi:Regulator of G protein signaling domain